MSIRERLRALGRSWDVCRYICVWYKGGLSGCINMGRGQKVIETLFVVFLLEEVSFYIFSFLELMCFMPTIENCLMTI